MEFVLIGFIALFVLHYNNKIDANRFIKELEPHMHFLMEDDYRFLVHAKYGGSDEDVDRLFAARIRNGLVTIVILVFIFLSQLNFINIVLAFIIGYVVFKMQYIKIKGFYKANLHNINMMLPYYLKSLEILIQHYTVPVALNRSVETAPEIFQPGLKRMMAKIEAGDATVDPYMDFAKEYPVRDSMRMMRLLYRLGLGSQENKQEQLMVFSKSVSSLQSKSRDLKYQERLDKMEKKTMTMLMVTGGGVLFLLMLVMTMMLQL
jgi:hypothetical protein